MFVMPQRGAATATVTEPVELWSTVGNKRIHLLQVHLDGRPFPQVERGTTFCLDVHENEGAMAAAVEFVKRIRSVRPGSVLTFTPPIFTLVNTSALSAEELRIVNNELIPAGSSIFEYPKTCNSFQGAMKALCEEMVEARRPYAEAEDKPSYLSALLCKVVESLTGSGSARRPEQVTSKQSSSETTKASAAQ